MQNSSLYTIKDSSATRFKCYNTSNDKIQQLYADTNKLHKCLNFLLELNIFKNTNNTHQKMQNSSLYTITPLLQPDSNATIHQTTRFSNCMQDTNKLHKCLNFLLAIKHFQKHKQHTSKDAEFIALHDHASSATRFKCYKTSNDKIQQLYADTNKLHKCFEFFAGIKHFQKHKQHTSKDAEFIAVHDHATSATRFKCYNTSNDKIQQMYADTNKLHKCLNLLLGIKHFQKHKQHISKNAEFIALQDHGQFCNQIQMLQYIKRQDSATVCRLEQTA